MLLYLTSYHSVDNFIELFFYKHYSN